MITVVKHTSLFTDGYVKLKKSFITLDPEVIMEIGARICFVIAILSSKYAK